MMVFVPVALWSIPTSDGQSPRRLEQRRDFVEAHLETWVEDDPSLVMDGLSWVGRQVVLPDRSRLDLVGLTHEGELVVAELKAGAVGIATLSQALHYAVWFGAMDEEAVLRRLRLTDAQRDLLACSLAHGGIEVSVLLVGTARLPELDRAISFLESSGPRIAVRIVTFTPFIDDSGTVFLARDVEESEQTQDDVSPKQRSSRAAKVEWVQELARDYGVGQVVDEYIAAAADLGLRVKPWPLSITIVPPFGHGRTLLYLKPTADGAEFGYSEENLADLYGADAADMAERFGENWTHVTADEARGRLRSFVDLVSTLQADVQS